MKNGDSVGVESVRKNILSRMSSCRMFDSEHVCHSFVLGLIANVNDRFDITADHESGDGYHGIHMVSRRPMFPHILIELKRTDGKADPGRLSEMALNQIIDRRYHYGLEGQVHMFGIAFDGKNVTVSFRKLEDRVLSN